MGCRAGHPQEDEAGKVNVIKQICSEAGAQERVVDSGPGNGDGGVNQSSRSQRAEAASQDPTSVYKSRRHREILGAWAKRDLSVRARAPWKECD